VCHAPETSRYFKWRVCQSAWHPVSKLANVGLTGAGGVYVHCSVIVTSRHPVTNVFFRIDELGKIKPQCPWQKRVPVPTFLRRILKPLLWNTRKPSCRKETARCRSCSFRFKVCRQFIHYRFKSTHRKSGFRAPNIPARKEFNAKWPFKVIQGHVFWSQWKGHQGLSNAKY